MCTRRWACLTSDPQHRPTVRAKTCRKETRKGYKRQTRQTCAGTVERCKNSLKTHRLSAVKMEAAILTEAIPELLLLLLLLLQNNYYYNNNNNNNNYYYYYYYYCKTIIIIIIIIIAKQDNHCFH